MTQEYGSERDSGEEPVVARQPEPSVERSDGLAGTGLPDDRRPAWRAALPRLLAVYLLSRVLVLLVAGALTAIPVTYHGDTWTDRPILSVLTGSDAVYYLGIAAEGYHVEAVKGAFYDWVFFPLYPAVVRVASIATLGDIALAGVLVANLAFLAALLVFYALSVRHLGRETALRAAGFLVLAPGAVAFTMAYTDSLFFLAGVGAMLAAERRRWPLAGLLYGMAALTRLPGVLLGIPLLLVMLQANGWRPTRAIAWLAPGPLALIGFAAWLGATVGDPLGFLTGQAAWVIAPTIGGGSAAPRFDPLPMLLIATLLGYTFLLVYLRPDRIALPYAALTLLALLTVVASLRLQSVARYLAVAWPFAWILANRQAAWFRESWPYLTAGLFTLHAVLHFTQAMAP